MKKRMFGFFICLFFVVQICRANVIAVNGTLPNRAIGTISKLGTSPNEAAFGSTNRASSVAATTIGGKDYAYVMASNGFYVFDITDPSAVQTVQTVPGTTIKCNINPRKVQVKDGYVIISNAVTSKIEFCQINADGTINTSTVHKTISASSDSGIKIIDNYLFVSHKSTLGVEIYDVSNIANPSTIVRMGRQMSTTQALAFDIEKISSTIYRIYYVDRVNAIYSFAVFEVEINGTTAAFTQKYYSSTPNFLFLNPSAINITVLTAGIIAMTSSSTVAQNELAIVNVSDPTIPTGIAEYDGRGQNVMAVDDTHYLYGTPDTTMMLYEQIGATRTQIGANIVTEGQAYEMIEYKGRLLIANGNKFNIWSLSTGATIETSSINEWAPSNIAGTVTGYNAGTDVVKISIDGAAEETLSVNNSTFSYPVPSNVTNDISVTVTLYRNSSGLVAAYKTIALQKTPYAVETVQLSNTDGNLVSLANGVVNAAVAVHNNDNSSINTVTVIAAVFEGGKLVSTGTQRIPVSANSSNTANLSVNVTDRLSQVLKIYVWSDMGSSMIPLAKVYQISSALSVNFPGVLNTAQHLCTREMRGAGNRQLYECLMV